MLRSTGRASALACAICLSAVVRLPASAAPRVLLAPEKTDPSAAAAERKPVQEQARNMRVSGDLAGAGHHLASEGTRLKDPVLLVDAADAFKDAGNQARDTALVEQAIEQAQIANDMLLFLGDDRASTRWQPVGDDHRQVLLARVDTLLGECRSLIQAIESESAAPEPAPVEQESKPARPGRVLIIAGAAALGLGIAGLGAGAAGLGIGASAQANVDDPTVYGEEFDSYDAKGNTGNLLAYIGFPVAALGIGAGAALIAIGLKKKRAGAELEQSTAHTLRVSPALSREAGGLSISGRF